MDGIKLENPELTLLKNNKKSGYNYRERRQADWEENYTLYRDKVTINRLTQRQSVNMPLMKQTIRTLLKDVDDMPVLQFENLDNKKEAQVFLNEYWKWTGEQKQNRIELQDIIDKRQVFLFGRSFDQWQIVDGKVKMTIEDPQDILVSRYTDPVDLHSSRFLIHTHIFKPLSTLEQNKDYDQKAVARLKQFYGTKLGLIKAADNQEMLIQKNKKMADLGVSDVYEPVLGETYVELSLHFVFREENGESQIWMYVECDDMEILLKKPLEEIIGVTKDHFWKTHYPYNSWADDLERQDFWSDSIGDIVRVPNKVLNSWFSQLVENRTLRNFGMHYYDSTIEGFVPSTFNPVPWGWYGVPGKPSEVLQKVEIPELSESLDEMQFVLTMVEKASGATATQQGVQQPNQTTLGEVELALGQAKERVKGMSKFYTPAWKDRGTMFLKMVEAGADKLDAVKIYKKGRNTDNIFAREISPKDWQTEAGYQVRVWSQDEKNAEDTDKLNKLNNAKMAMPDNMKLNEVYQRKVLEFADLTPDEINEIMQLEQQKRDMLASQAGMMAGAMQPPMAPMQTPPQAPAPAPMAPSITAPKKKSNRSKETVDKLKGLRSKIKLASNE